MPAKCSQSSTRLETVWQREEGECFVKARAEGEEEGEEGEGEGEGEEVGEEEGEDELGVDDETAAGGD